MGECYLKMTGICKSFGSVPVLKNVDLNFGAGEIHALLGENGAGKTTVMNILGGVLKKDTGNIFIDGKKAFISSPSEAQKQKIAFIHQEINVVNDLPVYENIFLGNEIITKGGKVNAKQMIKETKELFDSMGIKLDPRTDVHKLDASYKQIIEIAKALRLDAEIIIMDEPTSSLTSVEIENVFKLMKNLRSQNKTLIFISHKLNEVVEICDRFTVLRNGEKIIEDDIINEDGVTIPMEEIAKYMVGTDVLGVEVYEEHAIGEPILEVSNLFVDRRVKDVSFNLKKGEILGITGLLGDGKIELARALFGDLKADSGEIVKDGKKLKMKSPSFARKNKLALVPSNRKENGIIKDLSIKENLTLVSLKSCIKGITINRKLEDEAMQDYKEKLQIKMNDPNKPITNLSGGNQQKVVLGKWIFDDPDIIMLSNPTQGVDVGAKNEIYKLIMQLAKQGVSIIVTSDELEEILKICDRTLVMYHGELKGEIDRSELSQEVLMILSTGGSLANVN